MQLDPNCLVEHPCPICSSTANWVFREANLPESISSFDFNCTNGGHGYHFQIKACANCGMHYCSPRPNAEQLAELYGNTEDTTYLLNREARQRTFRRCLKNFRRRSGRLLDIGSNAGFFMEQAQQLGYKVEGVEPSDHAREITRSKGFNVYKNILSAPDNTYQTVTLWDVLEHVDDPQTLIEQAVSKLAPNGDLHLSTIFLDSCFARLLGRRWPWYMLMHIHYFDRCSLQSLLLRSGCTDIHFRRYTHYARIGYILERLPLPLRKHSLKNLINKIGVADLNVPIAMGDVLEVTARKR